MSLFDVHYVQLQESPTPPGREIRGDAAGGDVPAVSARKHSAGVEQQGDAAEKVAEGTPPRFRRKALLERVVFERKCVGLQDTPAVCPRPPKRPSE